MSSSNCCFLTSIQILKRQVRWSGIPISWRIFQFVVIHTVQGFGIVNKAEVDFFLVFSCFFYDTVDVGNLISSSCGFPKSSLNIWKFSVHTSTKENFEHCFARVWDEYNCVVVWAFFGFAFLWDWNENWSFPVLWPQLSFPNMLAYWVQHFHSIIFQNCSLVTFNLISFNVFIDVFPSYLKQMLCVVDI